MPLLHRAVASLQIRGESLEPHSVTRSLGAAPTLSYARGEQIPAGPGARTAPFGLWSLDSPATEPADVDAQVTHLLRRLSDDLAIWRELSEAYSVRLFCGWFLRAGNEGLVVTLETLGSLAERGIALDLDIYAR